MAAATWNFFGLETMHFQYLCLKLWEIPREEVLALNEPALLPLSWLTKGKIDRIMVKKGFDELIARKLYELLPIGETVAGWLLKGMDLEWLKREYRNMFNLFKDSPAYEWMTADAREEGLVQGREEARQQLLAAEEARQQALKTLREVLVALVAKPFPHLARLAKKQVRTIEDQERLRDLLLRINTAQDAIEVETMLLDLDDESKS